MLTNYGLKSILLPETHKFMHDAGYLLPSSSAFRALASLAAQVDKLVSGFAESPIVRIAVAAPNAKYLQHAKILTHRSFPHHLISVSQLLHEYSVYFNESYAPRGLPRLPSSRFASFWRAFVEQ